MTILVRRVFSQNCSITITAHWSQHIHHYFVQGANSSKNISVQPHCDTADEITLLLVHHFTPIYKLCPSFVQHNGGEFREDFRHLKVRNFGQPGKSQTQPTQFFFNLSKNRENILFLAVFFGQLHPWPSLGRCHFETSIVYAFYLFEIIRAVFSKMTHSSLSCRKMIRNRVSILVGVRVQRNGVSKPITEFEKDYIT